MAKPPTAIKIIQMRNQILANLNRIETLRAESLYRTVLPFDSEYNKQLFKKDMMYLHGKGYVCFVDDVIGGNENFDDKYFKLTPAGNEIANKINIDPALEI